METCETCRLCLKESEGVIGVFGEMENNLKISKIISQHLGFDSKEDDNLSKTICMQCWDKLKSFHEFYNAVWKAHESLANVKDYSEFESIPEQKINIVMVKGEIELEAESENDGLVDDGFNEFTAATDTNTDTSCASTTNTEKLSRQSHAKESQIRRTKRKTIMKSKTIKPKSTTFRLNLAQRQERMARIDEENRKIEKFYSMICEVCMEKSASYPDLLAHFRTVHNNSRGYVTCCNRKLRRRGYMLDHIQQHFKSYDCNVCNKNFVDEKTLRLHMFYHMPEEDKKYQCDICNRRYQTKSRLIQHMHEIHPTEDKKTFKCEHCEKRFIARHLLQTHQRLIHDSKYACVCDVCGKVFRTKNQCATHVQAIHSDENRDKFQCTICKSWLQNMRTLKRHIQRAHQEGPFPCGQCGRSIANKDALRNHIRYAHNPTQYPCKLCDKSYKSKLSLKEHMASHTGTALYGCVYCSRTFNSNANKYSHQKKKHPEDWQRDRDRRLGPKPELNCV